MPFSAFVGITHKCLPLFPLSVRGDGNDKPISNRKNLGKEITPFLSVAEGPENRAVDTNGLPP